MSMPYHRASLTGTMGGKNDKNSLLKIPVEILQMIASRLPTDLDMLNLALCCRELLQRVLDPDSMTWRDRFGDKYDIPRGRSSRELKAEYQIRAIVLPRKINFRKYNGRQHLWLEVIQTMLAESFTLLLPPGMTSKTYRKVQKAVIVVDFLNQPMREDSTNLFCAVQLCLTALALDMVISDCCLRTEYDIAAVYSYGDRLEKPFIDHDALDLPTLLHMRNFWQRHLLNVHEGTFYASFAQLPEDLKPKACRGYDSADAPDISTSWMGYYSCIHPLPDTIEKLQTRQTCADLDSHWEQVETMFLEIQIKTDDSFWPEECNKIIPKCEAFGMERKYFDGVQKVHGGNSNTGNPIFGFIEPIAYPWGGFSGWQRICFTICEQAEESDGDALHAGPLHWIHGYEAVILPGGRMMMGRWIDLKEPSGRGPFIFWDV